MAEITRLYNETEEPLVEATGPNDSLPIDVQTEIVLRSLHDKGVEYFVVEENGQQIFLDHIILSGIISNIRNDPSEDERSPDFDLQMITILGADGEREFGIMQNNSLQIGQEVVVDGFCTHYIDGPWNFLEDLSKEEGLNLLNTLKEMLTDRLEALALKVTIKGQEVYRDDESEKDIQELRNACLDSWDEIFRLFD